jgi:hypothetical protein
MIVHSMNVHLLFFILGLIWLALETVSKLR